MHAKFGLRATVCHQQSRKNKSVFSFFLRFIFDMLILLTFLSAPKATLEITPICAE